MADDVYKLYEDAKTVEEKLKTAYYFGADACYLGGKKFGARAYAGNFDLQELEEAAKTAENADIEEEFGDILFALVNISRFLKINPEFALTKAIKKFINRFDYIEKSAFSAGKDLSDMSLEEMDLLWDEAKIALRPNK